MTDPGDPTAPPTEPLRPPLAVRMRPRALTELAGQRHLLADGSPLRRLVESDAPLSVLLWGPPGTGKTTIADIVSQSTRRQFCQLSALDASVRDVRAIIETARRRRADGQQGTVLFVDELHRFTRTQQDSLLAAVEDRTVCLIAATTENPHIAVAPALLSRATVVQLRELGEDDVRDLLRRAVTDERGLAGTVSLPADACDALARMAGGDARWALTALEAAAEAALAGGSSVVDISWVEATADRALVRYDATGDEHYDVTSAFCKSLRGSDPDAALHWLARMLAGGEDPRFIARRLMVHASEDIGLADPTALNAAVSAAQVVALVGLPEARLALAQATVHLALAPKSNAILAAVDAAQADVVAGLVGPVPDHLRDAHYAGARKLGHGRDYVYPHDSQHGVVAQQYGPDVLRGREYYLPAPRGRETDLGARLQRLRAVLRGR